MNTHVQGPRVVAIGDSITLGVGDERQAEDRPRGWAAHVANAIGASSFTNLAVNGTRARDLVGDQVPRALELSPDIVLMSVGANDVLRGDFDPDEIRDHVRAVARWLAGEGVTVVAVSLTPIPIFGLFHQRVTSLMARRIHQTNAALFAAIEGTGNIILNGAIAMALVGPTAWHVDRIHPSPTGHRAIAERALGLLYAFPAVRTIPSAAAPPGRVATALWLIHNGLPWALKRSCDLLPRIAAVIRDELRRERMVEEAAIRAIRDSRGRVNFSGHGERDDRWIGLGGQGRRGSRNHRTWRTLI